MSLGLQRIKAHAWQHGYRIWHEEIRPQTFGGIDAESVEILQPSPTRNVSSNQEMPGEFALLLVEHDTGRAGENLPRAALLQAFVAGSALRIAAVAMPERAKVH